MTAAPAFLAQTLEDLRALNAYVHDRALRLYQHGIATAGLFVLRSPWTGQTLRLSANRIETVHALSYAFDDGIHPVIMVETGGLAAGFPLVRMQTGESIWMIATGALSDRPIRSAVPAELPRIDTSKPAQILIGNRNFAHFIWNEYPALHVIGDDLTAELIAFHDPLLLLQQHVADRPGLVLRHAETINGLRGWSDRATGVLGAQYLDAAPKAQALAHFRHLGQGALTGSHPRLYVSLRFAPRSSSDQQEMINALIRAFLSHWPQGSVVIDGFSMPGDFARPIYDNKRAAFLERVAVSQAMAAALIAELPMPMQGKVVDITGMPLASAINTALDCDYYVCHSGTLQHKIGWFAEIAGFIHSNSLDIRYVARRWSGNQTHGSKIPAGPSLHLIRDVAHDWGGPISQRPRNSDYAFTDIPALVAEMLADMRQHLAAPSCDP